MPNQPNEADLPIAALAALAVAFARTLNESDPTFVRRLRANAEALYRELEDRSGIADGSYEMLASLNFPCLSG